MEVDAMARLIVGMDLALKSSHRAVIYDEQEKRFRGKVFAVSRTFDGLQAMMRRFEPNDEVGFVMEPTGSAWRPVAAFLVARGHTACLVRPDKSAALRKFYSRHTKSNRADAKTLAKMPGVDPEGVYPFTMPKIEVARLRDLGRHRDRIVSSAADRKRRIESKFDQLMPTLMDVLGSDKFTLFSRQLMRNYANPFRLHALGRKRFARWARTRGADQHMAEAIFDAAESAVHIYTLALESHRLPFDFEQSSQEIDMELDLLEHEERQVVHLESQIASVYQRLDPEGLMKTLPGFGEVIAPVILAETLDVGRFDNVASYRCFVSLIPRQSRTGNDDLSHPKSMRIRKSGSRLLKKYFYLAAETARRFDVECASIYHRLKRRGRHHTQALCAVANKLASRAYAVMNQMGSEAPRPYQYRDLDGRPVSKQRAKEIIQTASQRTLVIDDPGAPRQKKGESLTRTLCTRPSEDASKKRATGPLPIGDTLKDITAEVLAQA
jgi:transposase